MAQTLLPQAERSKEKSTASLLLHFCGLIFTFQGFCYQEVSSTLVRINAWYLSQNTECKYNRRWHSSVMLKTNWRFMSDTYSLTTFSVNPQNHLKREDSWQGFIVELIQQQCHLKEFHFASHKVSPNSSDFKIVLEDMEMSEIDFIANCTPNTC